jgi:hypothetical protein
MNRSIRSRVTFANVRGGWQPEARRRARRARRDHATGLLPEAQALAVLRAERVEQIGRPGNGSTPRRASCCA